MSEDCIFCSIVDGEIPARVVHEGEEAIAFLDANPLAPGHTLVIPKTHNERLADMDEDTANAVFQTLYDLVDVVERGVDADGANVGFNDGEAAGQEVPHVHGHIIPRFEGDGGYPLHAVAGESPDLSEDELDEIASDIESRAND
ncbi:HIT family protein [Halobacterium zhouii]|uniref:HIT family protein n=1 Tax=Halobacterium zhouii TaxID=2902624 RepID=UPI001E3D0849|nr:HIT family protein [Halobacterium zhouii]